MIRKFVPVIILPLFLPLSSLPAQTAPAPAPAPGGNRGNFDPAAIHDRLLGRFKTALAPTDDEWKLIEPKLTKVFLLELDVMVMPGMGGGGRFNPRSFIRAILDPNAQPSQVEEKSQDLQNLIDNNEVSNSAYTNALAQLRKARERARTDLATAQKDLTTLLTIRQEATLVQLGLLE